MNALDSLTTGNVEENQNVTSLLRSTHEVERRIQEIMRWWRLWDPSVRQGWQLLGRYRVSQPLLRKPRVAAAGKIPGEARFSGRTGQLPLNLLHNTRTVILAVFASVDVQALDQDKGRQPEEGSPEESC